MQAALVIRTPKIIPPQLHNRLIIPPQKEHNDSVKRPRATDLTPHRHRTHIQRRHRRKRREPLLLRAITLRQIDRNHNGAADDAHAEEDVAAHLGEAQEDGGVETDAVDELGLFGAPDRGEPGEEAATDGRRGAFVVCMLDFGGVDDGVPGPEEREEEGEEDGDDDGCDEGRRHGIELELQSVSELAIA